MKIFIHDQKHGRIIGEYNIGEPTGQFVREIERFVEFLNDNITSRYNRLVVANSYHTTYTEEHDDSEITFS